MTKAIETIPQSERAGKHENELDLIDTVTVQVELNFTDERC